MAQALVEESANRIIIVLDPGGPIELDGLSVSFASLARYYERYYRPTPGLDTAPKLFVTHLSTGSILLEIAPYVMLFGQAFVGIGGAVTVADFTNRLSHALRAFSDPQALTPDSDRLALTAPPSRDDAADLREFIRPLTGKRGAALGIRHARFKASDGERETVAEFTFDETEINLAAANIERVLSSDYASITIEESEIQKEYKEVMLFFQQASRAPSKETGRTGDRAVVPDISDKTLPTYFRKSINDLKDKMIRGEDNPLTKAFIVDVHVQVMNGEPKAYIVTEVHDVIDVDPA